MALSRMRLRPLSKRPEHSFVPVLEKAGVWIIGEPSPDTQYDDTLPLDFLASSTMRKNPVVYQPGSMAFFYNG